MVDAQVIAALQNGTAFFASTSLIAIGGALSLLRVAGGDAAGDVALCRSARRRSRELWEIEDDGARRHLRLRVLQIRLVVPAVQLLRDPARRGAAGQGARTRRRRKAFARRASSVCADAGRHFNRGQRAFFFALGYLGWFFGALPLAITTAGVLIVMWRRQFASPARKAFESAPL